MIRLAWYVRVQKSASANARTPDLGLLQPSMNTLSDGSGQNPLNAPRSTGAFSVALRAHLTIACFHRLVDWLITTQIAVLSTIGNSGRAFSHRGTRLTKRSQFAYPHQSLHGRSARWLCYFVASVAIATQDCITTGAALQLGDGQIDASFCRYKQLFANWHSACNELLGWCSVCTHRWN